MDYGKEFKKYATQHMGMNSMHVDHYIESSMQPVGLTPNIIEERQLNVASMDIFSRLMMDRIIFLGVPINDQVANIIMGQLLFLDSTDPNRNLVYVFLCYFQFKLSNYLLHN